MVHQGNKSKIEAIVKSIGKVDSVIDIGCNYGYMIKSVIESGQANRCYGVERLTKTVDPELINNPKFVFYEADLTKFDFPETYDVSIYTAVHHRIFDKSGKNEAFKVWKKIVDSTKRIIIFETGVLQEDTGDDKWPETLAKYYKNNEEHLSDILSVVGDRLLNIEEILVLPMRGTMRPVYKMELLK